MVINMEDRLIQALEYSFKESCAFVQAKPYLSKKEILGDFYTRLSRHFKSYSIEPILDRDCVQGIFISNNE